MALLTPRQAEAYRYIRTTYSKRGVPPSLKELALAMGLKSRQAAERYVSEIKKKGYKLEEAPQHD